MRQYEKNQLDVFNKLIDSYEKKKNYGRDDIKMKRVSITPDKILSSYGGRFADIDKDERFTLDLLELEEIGLITLEKDKKSKSICKICAIDEKWDEYYTITKRKTKQEWIEKYIADYSFLAEKYKDNIVISHICNELLNELYDLKLPGGNSHAAYFQRNSVIFSLIHNIMHNQQTLYIREFSQKYLGDTKIFSSSYKHAICKYIYNILDWKSKLPGLDIKDYSENTLIEYIILGEYHIFPNPVFIYMNGDITLSFNDGSVLQAKRGLPLAISSERIQDIKDITLLNSNVVTIENKTSFSRFNESDSLAIYIEGYNSSSVSEFIKKINEFCHNVSWYHFGDLDPDGFYILEHLKQTTGIDFVPKYMDLDTLCNYKKYGKKLESNDKTKAKNLLKTGLYCDVVNYMLEHDIKLEQEIVSFLLS